jgi:hypothetical protein
MLFAVAPPVTAWRTIPSWYVVAQDDRAINPDLERFYAKRIGATIKKIKASHTLQTKFLTRMAGLTGGAPSTS